MADKVLGMAPLALSVPSGVRHAPTAPLRSEAKYLGNLCCGKAKWTVYKGMVVTACLDHSLTCDFQPLEPKGGT